MSVINPNPGAQRFTAQPAKNRKPQGEHLSPAWRAEKILVSPLAGIGKTLTSGLKGTGVATATVGGLFMTKHPILGLLAGAGSFVGVPLYAVAKGLGRFFGNIKAGITGHTAAKN